MPLLSKKPASSQTFPDLGIPKRVNSSGRWYKQAQVIFKDESPWLTIAHSITNQPMRKEVIGYKINPLGDHDFYGVDLQP
jgi:ABC-type transport system substrate-binding protein